MGGVVTGDDGLARTPWAATSDLLRQYYDTEWGVPIVDERGMFERLVLEGFQAGLSWETVLRKRDAFREGFADFCPDVVATFTVDDVERLMDDARIIRNRRKIEAAITNARATVALRSHGTDLAALCWGYMPERTPVPTQTEDVPSSSDESAALAKELKARGFSFVGPVTVFALMEAVGIVDTHLIGSHRRGVSGLWAQDGTRQRHPLPRMG